MGSRKKTNNKWFETQDSINYWEDFFKPKIVWKRVGSILRFAYDESGALALDSTCFATGQHLKFLLIVLNSKIGKYLLKDSPQTGTGDLLISVQAIEPLKIPIPDSITEISFERLADEIMNENKAGRSIVRLEKETCQMLYKYYDFDEEEIDFIECLYNQ